MKRTSKAVFFIVALLIAALAYTTFVGVYTYFGDRRDTIIRGASDIRWGIDIQGGVNATFGPADPSIKVTEEQLNAVKEILSQRLVLKNITDHEIFTDTTNKQVVVQFPWGSGETTFDPTKTIEDIGQTAKLEFHEGDTKDGALVIDGEDVESARAQMIQDPNTGATEPAVILTLKASGKQDFANATAKLAGTGSISIWLDENLLSSPRVKEQITNGEATISGGFSNFSEAVELANLINSGALPFSIKATDVSTIPPSLGAKALDAMVLAGAIAFVLVSLFMILYYRLPGFVAVIALLGQVAGSIAAVSGYFGFFESFTLTLPGVAGIILSIGMGVDANVITSERIKEEIRTGKTIDGAIYSGTRESFSAIFDGNITVIIVAIVLMGVFGPSSSFASILLKPIIGWFGASTTGFIYSFGYTLFIGVIFNFIMGMTASRLMLSSLSRFKPFRKPWLYGGERA